MSGCPDGLGVAPVTKLGQGKTSKNLTGGAGHGVRREGSSSVLQGLASPAQPAPPRELAARRHGSEPQPPPVCLAGRDGTASPCRAGRHATWPVRAAGETDGAAGGLTKWPDCSQAEQGDEGLGQTHAVPGIWQTQVCQEQPSLLREKPKDTMKWVSVTPWGPAYRVPLPQAPQENKRETVGSQVTTDLNLLPGCATSECI